MYFDNNSNTSNNNNRASGGVGGKRGTSSFKNSKGKLAEAKSFKIN